MGADASPQPKQQPYVYFYLSRSLIFCWVLWCMHFSWNSNTDVYSSLCSQMFCVLVPRFHVRWLFLVVVVLLHLPGRGCVDCLNLIGQYNLHEPLRPITMALAVAAYTAAWRQHLSRGCIDCLNLIGQYNLHEPLRPIIIRRQINRLHTPLWLIVSSCCVSHNGNCKN